MTGQEKYPLEDIAKRWIEETPLFSVDHAVGQLLLHTLSMEQQLKQLTVQMAELRVRMLRLQGEDGANE